MPPRRSLGRRNPGLSSPVTRRPRVAGRRHTDPSGAPEKGPEGAPAVDTGPGGSGAATSAAVLVIGVLVLVIALVLAAWFRGEANQLSGSAAASNSALVDVGSTAQVSGQVRAAVERIYSYDFARLDDNERAAGELITGSFAADFHEQFALVRKLAPAQQAVVVARVLNLGVKMLDGDRAIVVLFIDQQASRGIETSQLSVAGRLTVTAQRVDGNWKIADIEPF